MAAMTGAVVAVVVGVTLAVEMVMVMGMTMVVAVFMGMLMGVSMSIVSMLMSMGMGVRMIVCAAQGIVMNVHNDRSFTFSYIILPIAQDVKTFLSMRTPPGACAKKKNRV